jgi:multiple sugar transport system substrate-binding protein
MKRRAAVAASIGLVGALLGACGDDEGGDGDGKTVVVWDRAGAEASTRQAFFEEWNKNEGAELGITVQYEPQATERYEEVVRLGFQTQRGPDIFHGPSSQMGGFVGAGWVQPLDGLVDDAVLADAERYLPETSELVWGGRPYAIPTTTFTVRLVINRTLFDEAGLDPDDPPTTFSEVEDAARAITESSGGEAYGVALPMGWVGFRQWTVDIPILSTDQSLAQNGLFNLATGEYQSERYEPIVEHYRALIAEGTAYPGAETLNIDTMLGAFADGKVGMVLSSGSIVGGLMGLGADIDLGAGPIPVPDGASQAQSPMNAGFPYSISSTTENPEAAATVFGVLVGPEMQQALAEGGIPPLSEDAWDSPVALENESLQLFRPQDNDQQWPKTPGSVISVEGENAETTIISLIMNPDADPAGELSDLAERYQNAYQAGVDSGEVDPAEFRGS